MNSALAKWSSYGVFALLAAGCSGPSELSSHGWPTTLDAALVDILDKLSSSDRDLLRATKKEDVIQFHHGWGTVIRNEYGLWRGNDALIHSACGGPCHPDDASMVIIETVWSHVRKTNPPLPEDVAQFVVQRKGCDYIRATQADEELRAAACEGTDATLLTLKSRYADDAELTRTLWSYEPDIETAPK